MRCECMVIFLAMHAIFMWNFNLISAVGLDKDNFDITLFRKLIESV